MAGPGKDAADWRVSYAIERVKRYDDIVPHSAPSFASDGCLGAKGHPSAHRCEGSLLRWSSSQVLYPADPFIQPTRAHLLPLVPCCALSVRKQLSLEELVSQT